METNESDLPVPSVANTIRGYLFSSRAEGAYPTAADPLPFAALSTEDFQHLRTPPPKYTRNHSMKAQSSTRRGKERATSPSTSPRFLVSSSSSFSRPLRRKTPQRSLSPTPSPSLRRSLRDRKTPRTEQPERSPRRRSRSSQSWLSYFFSPSWPLLLMVIFPCIAIIYISNLLQPLTVSLSNVVTRLTDINPLEAAKALWVPTAATLAAIPYSAIWCGSIGIGCTGVDRYAAYTTDSFHSLPLPVEQISLGNDFFDCLNDLKITRQEKNAVAHLVTLAPKVMQYEHVLENPEELSDNLILLARTRREIVMNANAARVTGRGTVGNIIQEFEHARYLSSTKSSQEVVQARFRDTMSAAHESLQATSDYTLRTSSAVQTAEEIASKVAVQIHQEISRLLRMKHESEVGIDYLAWGWIDGAWDNLQPGRKGMRHDREKAGEFLKEVLRLVDEGAVVLLSNSMSLQQCAINTRGFKDQVEKAFTLAHERLTIHTQLQHLSPSIESLETRLAELRQSDAAPAMAQVVVQPQSSNTASGNHLLGTAT